MDLVKNVTNGIAEGFCILKTVEQKITTKKTPFLDLVLADGGGEMNAKLWDYSPERHGEYEAGMIVKVRGTIDKWNNIPQLKIDRIRPATSDDPVPVDQLVPCAPYGTQWMYQQLIDAASQITDGDIQAILLELLHQNKEALLIWPAAVKMHHAVRGGLLYHTLSMLRVAQRICDVYPILNRDLVCAGIILHDLGKTEELDVSDAGTANGYTVRGQLIGHLCGGVVNLEKIGEQLGTPKETLLLLEHMVYSHHGIPEFGSPIRPMFPEAEVVSQLDTLDATLFEMDSALSKVQPGEVTGKVWGLDRKLYRHSRFEPSEKTNLE